MRFFGILFLVAIFLASGANKIADPAPIGKYISSSPSVQHVLKLAGVKLAASDFVLLAQVTGGFMVAASTFIILGVARGFFAFLLALQLLVITVLMHVDITKPESLLSNQTEFVNVLKNLSIFGGLIIVATLRSPKAAPAQAATNAKKRQ